MKLTSLIEGVALGAVGMFFLDPDRGGRRRALLRDQAIHQGNKKRRAVQVMARDFVNRSKGLRYQIQSKVKQRDVPDELLVERARAEIGHVVSHSSSVEVTCENGLLLLSGPILATELDACLRQMQMIPGVVQVLNNLDVYSDPAHISALQGGVSKPAATRWTPAMCLVMGLTGVFCAVYGRSRKGIVGTAMQVGGMGILAKAFNDTEQRYEAKERSFVEAGSTQTQGRQRALPVIQDSEPVMDRGQAGMI